MYLENLFETYQLFFVLFPRENTEKYGWIEIRYKLMYTSYEDTMTPELTMLIDIFLLNIKMWVKCQSVKNPNTLLNVYQVLENKNG